MKRSVLFICLFFFGRIVHAQAPITSSSFAAKVDFRTAPSPRMIAAGDLDGDGKPDLVVVYTNSYAASIFRNTSTTPNVSFASRIDLPLNGANGYVKIADIDGDGKPDLVVTNNDTTGTNPGVFSIFRNTSTPGNISFASEIDSSLGHGGVSDIGIIDFDGDGKFDLAIGNWTDSTVSIYRNASTPGSISFASRLDLATGHNPWSIATGDLDGDGKPDFAVTNQFSHTVSVYRNTSTLGNISFNAKVDFVTDADTGGNGPNQVSLVDVDGDGKLDVVVTGWDKNLSIFRNTSTPGSITSGSFAPKVSSAITSSWSSWGILQDLNEDSKPDLIVTSSGSNVISLYQNQSTVGSITSNSFASAVNFATGNGVFAAVVQDFDKDGKPDLAVTNSSDSTISVLLNTIPSPSINTQSAYFDGNARIRVTDASPANPSANPSAYQVSGTAITLEAWAFPMDVPTGNDVRYIIMRPSNNGFGVDPYETFALMIYGNPVDVHQPRFGVEISDGTHPIGAGYEYFVDDTGAVNVGAWTHIAATYDGSTIKLYINGALVRQVSWTVGLGTGSTGLYIGGGAAGYFKGLIDEVRLWNVARSQSDIQATMNTTLYGNESGLVGYWPMDSTYTATNGLATVDKSPNHNDLYVQFDTKMLTLPEGSTVQIPTTNVTLSMNYAETSDPYKAQLGADGWPMPSYTLNQKPTGMSLAGDSLFWQPTESQYGNFPVIVTATQDHGSLVDTVSVFSEVLRSLQNQLRTDITHRGKLGTLGNYGRGMIYKGKNGLFVGDFSLVDRAAQKYAGGLYSPGNGIQPFQASEAFSTIPSRFPGFTALKTSFTDSLETNRIGVRVIQIAHVSTNPGDDKYDIIEWRIVNASGAPISDLFAQLTLDLDIGSSGNDLGGYDSLQQMSYGYESGGANNPSYFGFALLHRPVSGEGVFINGDQGYLRSTTNVTTMIPVPTSTGDIINQISTGPFNIAVSDTFTVAFAVMAGDDLNDIRTSAARARQVYSGNSLTWSISVSASSGSATDSSSYAGVATGATDAFDSTLDVPKPPRPPSGYVYTYFPHPEWGSVLGPNFLSDVRHDTVLSSLTKVWNFAVSTDQLNKTMSVGLSLNGVPPTYPVLLRDAKTGAVQDVRVNNTYSYNTGTDSTRMFQLVVGPLAVAKSRAYNAGWSMVGLPVKANTTLKDSIFGLSPTSYLYGYSSGSGYFTTNSLGYGVGYWLGATSTVTATVHGTEYLDTVKVPLTPGFNIVSLPYADSGYSRHVLRVQKGTTMVGLDSAASLGWVSPSLYGYRSGSYSQADTLTPWNGYWFGAIDSSLQLIYSAPVHITVPLAKRASQPGTRSMIASSSNWLVPMTLSVGNSVDRLGEFGMETGATNGFDAQYDLPHPPNPPTTDYVSLVFPHPEWGTVLGPNFSTDVRSPGELMTWNLKAGYAGGTGTAVLAWDTSAVPTGVGLTLNDFATGAKTDMKKVKSYEFTINGMDSLTIAAVVTGVGQEGSGIPTVYGLNQNYPNPFNPTTNISFSLPEQSNVRLTIIDLLGREVATLVNNEQRSAGNYTVTWNASSFASGVYFYRLQAGNFVQTKKLVLLK